MPRKHSDDVLNTYRFLRLSMALLVALLAATVVWQIASSSPHCLQTSISAYFYTPARGVFVGSLCAMGVCLIVYQGNTNIEDVLLNFTGAAAFIIAFVPTNQDKSCNATNVPSDSELASAITNNVSALLIVAVAGVAIARKINPTQFKIGDWDGWAKFWLATTSVALAAGAAYFLFDRSWFRSNGHQAAAISLFAGIVLVVLANAISYGRHRKPPVPGLRKYVNRYGYLALILVLTGSGVLVAHGIAGDKWTQWLFWLEATVIFQFGVHWAIQTKELWNNVKRGEESPPVAPTANDAD
jgi:hypothetical protein